MIPGDKVKYRAAFLRSVGLYAGDEAHATFTVVACDCWMCQQGYVAVDQPAMGEGSRHINVKNLILKSELHKEMY